MSDAKTTFKFCALVLVLALSLQCEASGQGRAARARKARAAVSKKMNRLPTGMWGGQHVRLDVTARGARVEFDCAHGTLEGPVTLDAGQRFDVRGTFTRERGGPTRIPPDAADGQTSDEGADTFPARYTGQVKGKSLTLTVAALDSGETLGTFSLGHGRQPVLTKCL